MKKQIAIIILAILLLASVIQDISAATTVFLTSDNIMGTNDDADMLNSIKTYIEEGVFEDIQFGARLKASKRTRFYLSHYPTFVNNFDDPVNVWNISAHTHSKEKFEIKDKKIYCVSLDAHDCCPVNIETILNDINERKQNVRH